MSDAQTYKFNVAMSCGGCKTSVENALKKVEGVESVDVNLADQLVIVNATIAQEDVLETIKKTGKKVTPLIINCGMFKSCDLLDASEHREVYEQC
ncbi:5809_t:CDS:2 [Ambispora gerdemannii]|uniref:5809_t:CDS:1 n=1 Tax=Ambispora gerdemannii TaxID=144530 RepID=A0A9N9H400_9GLOM|nr:5809_t:CDS:2 [Ambispora gerdemannii]